MKLVYSVEFISFINNSWDEPEYIHPISQDIISKLKKEKLTDNKKIKKLKNKYCAICRDEFKTDGREITNIGCHIFCTECIETWLGKYKGECPICRKKIS